MMESEPVSTTSSDSQSTGVPDQPTERKTVQPRSSSWFRRLLLDPIIGLLRSGLTVDDIAKSLALGATTGISPLIGTTTVTGGVLAAAFRLNLVACLTANYGVYPAQILLVIPFARLGQHLTGWNNLPLSPAEFRVLLQDHGFGTLQTLGTTLGNAALAWLLCAPFVFLITNLTFRSLLRRWREW